MRDYVITVNSTVDLPKEWLEERSVPVIPLKYTMDGKTYEDMNGLTAKEFFDKLREGIMSVTSQVNPEEAKAALEPFLKEGKDVLHLAFSSGLSGTCNSMVLAAEQLTGRVSGGEGYSDRYTLCLPGRSDYFFIKHCSLRRKGRPLMRLRHGQKRISFISAMM